MNREEIQKLLDKYSQMEHTELKDLLIEKIKEFDSYDAHIKQTNLEFACLHHIKIGDEWYQIREYNGKPWLSGPGMTPPFMLMVGGKPCGTKNGPTQDIIDEITRETDYYYDYRVEIECLLFCLEMKLREMSKPKKNKG